MKTIAKARPLPLLQRIRLETGAREDAVPSGYKSVSEWAAEWEHARVTAWRLLERASSTKPPMMHKKLLRRRNATGGINHVPYYAEV